MLREAGAQVVGELGHLGLLDAERGGERLARDVVGRAAEAAGDDEVVDAVVLAADELRDRVDLVRDGRGQDDADAQRLEPLREPGGVRVLDVAADDLVADGEDGGEHGSSVPKWR